ncbi:unnamed protein product [Peniophora sp. CBMAI 1063]|nr:unnamed protein product [Peniophora sp. CBMAI 1063]
MYLVCIYITPPLMFHNVMWIIVCARAKTDTPRFEPADKGRLFVSFSRDRIHATNHSSSSRTSSCNVGQRPLLTSLLYKSYSGHSINPHPAAQAPLQLQRAYLPRPPPNLPVMSLFLDLAAHSTIELPVARSDANEGNCSSASSLESLGFGTKLLSLPPVARKSDISPTGARTRECGPIDGLTDDVLGVENREVFSPDEYDLDAHEIELIAIPTHSLDQWSECAFLPLSPASATESTCVDSSGSRYAVLATSTPPTSAPGTPKSCSSLAIKGKGKARELFVTTDSDKPYLDFGIENDQGWEGLEASGRVGEYSRSRAAWMVLHDHVQPWCAQEEYARWQGWHAGLDTAPSSPPLELQSFLNRSRWTCVRSFVNA